MSKGKKNKHKKKAKQLARNHATFKSTVPNIAILNRFKLLLKNRNIDEAIEHVVKHFLSMRVTDERLSDIIYEYYIKPDENTFLERFNKNVQFLKSHNVLIPDFCPDFENAKISTFAYHGWSLLKEKEIIISKSQSESSLLLLVDLINLDIIQGYVEGRKCLYLAYDDLRNFYYLLIFEDLSLLEKDINAGKIVFLICNDNDVLMNFFSNTMVQLPNHGVDKSKHKNYGNIINEVVTQSTNRRFYYLERLYDYYKDLDNNYYKDLFSKEPKDIKILLPTPQRTTLNKFITKNWYNAFLDLGYNAEYFIDKKLYEQLTVPCLWEKMYEFKPDIVFYINYTVDWLTPHENNNPIIKNLLWIMRYRDLGSYTKTKNNMFILPFTRKYLNHAKESIGISENRILFTADGVDIKLFNTKSTVSSRYSSDIVCVNNKVGHAMDVINTLLEVSTNHNYRKLIYELCNEIKKTSHEEEVFSIDSSKLIEMIKKELVNNGFNLSEAAFQFVLFNLTIISDIYYREKIMEWIIDSKITRNIKVWGDGWHKVEQFKEFNMGLARYNELPNVYKNSKITICSTYGSYFHERNFEIWASGGFPIIKYMGDNFTEPDIRDCFKENEDVVLYYNKDDLLNKIQYYLNNHEERERIADNGRKITCQQFTNTVIAKKTMDFIKNYYFVNSK